MELDTILVPVDFSEASRRAVNEAVFLGKRLGGRLELLHVWEPPTYLPPDAGIATGGLAMMSLSDYGRAEADRDMKALLESLRAEGVSATGRVEMGGAAKEILRAAAELPA